MLVRLEMDEERMSLLWSDYPPGWAVLLSLTVHLAAGLALGALYFRSIWWTARRFIGGGRLTAMIAMAVARFSLLGALLTLASLEGALPLLAMALGLLVSRAVVMRGVREVVP